MTGTESLDAGARVPVACCAFVTTAGDDRPTMNAEDDVARLPVQGLLREAYRR
jgi:hypothetical protein